MGNIFTVYELINNEEYADSVFFGTDPYLFKRCLQVLERQEKVSDHRFDRAHNGSC
jgi:hypothetical protein